MAPLGWAGCRPSAEPLFRRRPVDHTPADWAVKELAIGHAQEANDGFRTALHVNPEDKQAATNLDILRGELLAL